MCLGDVVVFQGVRCPWNISDQAGRLCRPTFCPTGLTRHFQHLWLDLCGPHQASGDQDFPLTKSEHLSKNGSTKCVKRFAKTNIIRHAPKNVKRFGGKDGKKKPKDMSTRLQKFFILDCNFSFPRKKSKIHRNNRNEDWNHHIFRNIYENPIFIRSFDIMIRTMKKNTLGKMMEKNCMMKSVGRYGEIDHRCSRRDVKDIARNHVAEIAK